MNKKEVRKAVLNSIEDAKEIAKFLSPMILSHAKNLF